ALAVRPDRGAEEPARERGARGEGAGVTTEARPVPTATGRSLWQRVDNRYLAPILVTLVLVMGQLTFGFLESWWRTALAIATAILVEIVLSRLFWGKWPHLASS